MFRATLGRPCHTSAIEALEGCAVQVPFSVGFKMQWVSRLLAATMIAEVHHQHTIAYVELPIFSGCVHALVLPDA